MQSRTIRRALTALPLLLLIGASAAAVNAAKLQSWHSEQVVAAVPLQTEPGSTGLSPRDHADLLSDCHTNMESLSSLLMAPEDRARMVEACAGIATSIIEASPRTSYAWFVKALVDEERLDRAQTIEDLIQSQQLAPRSANLAYYRVQKLFTYFADLDETARGVLVSDIETSAQSQRGIDWLARYYLRKPEFHDILTSGIEAAGTETSRRFLAAVANVPR